MYVACVISDDWTLNFTEDKTVERARQLSDIHEDLKKFEDLKKWLTLKEKELDAQWREEFKKDPSNAYGKDKKHDALLSLASMQTVLSEVQRFIR